jgi:hypothetical protein
VTGKAHTFRLLVDEKDTVAASVLLPVRCSDHPKGTVRRNGTYGQAKRQRYVCTRKDEDSDDPEKKVRHFFTLPLPREHVDKATKKCGQCDEFISVHKGTQASSRRSKWAMRAVVEGLVELANGTSYSKASQNIWEKTDLAVSHEAAHDAPPVLRMGAGDQTTESWSSERGRNAWHVAGDLVEQYSPLLYEHVMKTVHAREAERRRVNDEEYADGLVLASPLMFIMDEIPVYVRFKKGRSRNAWTVYTVAETLWHPGPTPMDMPSRESRLRLARALPGPASTEGWLLVLDELGVRPDVVVCDFGQAMANAISIQYAGQPLTTIPSLYHFLNAMELMFHDTPGYHTTYRKKRHAIPVLVKHVQRITRDNLVAMGVQGWRDWWDEFEQVAVDLGAPLAPIRNRRDIYEDAIAAAIPTLTMQPFLPASNAGIEIKNRSLLKPLLRGRQQRYRNIARTNALFDLLVCQENRLFNNTDLITKLIRDDNEAFGGWSTRLRSFNDRQPPVIIPATPDPDGEEPATKEKPRYSSLLDTGLVPALLEAR